MLASGILPGSSILRGDFSGPYDPSHPAPPPSDVYQAPEDSWHKVLGAEGAALGAFLGRICAVPAGVAVGAAAGTVAGPAGTAAGAVAGGAVAAKLEFSHYGCGLFLLGRITGGAIGGAIGLVAGKAAEALHIPAPFSRRTVEETDTFKYGKLLRHLPDVKYTTHAFLGDAGADELMKYLKPGDVLITNDDRYIDFDLPEKMLGGLGDWTHSALYVGNGNIVEVQYHGCEEHPLKKLTHMTHHALILRPAYKDDKEIADVIAASRRDLGKPFDWFFNLTTNDRYYCFKETYRALKTGAPHMDVEEQHYLGRAYVGPEAFLHSKDMTLIYSTGSSYHQNYLSKFC